MNILIGGVVEFATNPDQYTMSKFENSEQNADNFNQFYRNVDIENSQRELSADNSPPINVWTTAGTIFKLLGKGIIFPFAFATQHMNTIVEKIMLYLFKIWMLMTYIQIGIIIFKAIYIKTTSTGGH